VSDNGSGGGGGGDGDVGGDSVSTPTSMHSGRGRLRRHLPVGRPAFCALGSTATEDGASAAPAAPPPTEPLDVGRGPTGSATADDRDVGEPVRAELALVSTEGGGGEGPDEADGVPPGGCDCRWLLSSPKKLTVEVPPAPPAVIPPPEFAGAMAAVLRAKVKLNWSKRASADDARNNGGGDGWGAIALDSPGNPSSSCSETARLLLRPVASPLPPGLGDGLACGGPEPVLEGCGLNAMGGAPAVPVGVVLSGCPEARLAEVGEIPRPLLLRAAISAGTAGNCSGANSTTEGARGSKGSCGAGGADEGGRKGDSGGGTARSGSTACGGDVGAPMRNGGERRRGGGAGPAVVIWEPW